MTTRPRALIEALGDGVIVVSDTGQVLGWYGAAQRLFGYSADRMLGRPVSTVLDETAIRAEPQRVSLAQADGSVFDAVVTARPAAGIGTVIAVKELEPWLGPVGLPAGAAGAAATEALGDIFRRTMEVSGADFESGEQVESAARLLAEQGRRLVPDSDCLILLVPADRQDWLRVVAGAGPWGITQVGLEYEWRRAQLGQALVRHQVVEFEDAPSDPVRGTAYAEGGICVIRAVPLFTRQPLPDGRTSLGVLGLYRRVAGPYSPLQRRLIDDFGQLVSISLQRAELRLAATRTSERLQVAVDVAVDLAQSLDVQEVVALTIRRAMGAVGAERGALVRVERGETVVEDAHDLTGRADLIGYRQPVAAQPLMAEAIRLKEPVLGGGYDVRKLPRVLAEALHDVRHTVTLPLQFGGDVVAALILSKRRGPGFGSEQVETLQLLGSVAVLALRNAWLFEETAEAGRVKSEFLNMAAHELRTPLTVIMGYLSMLREGSLGEVPETWRHPIDVLGEKADELARLVDDLLTAARLETGRLAFRRTALDLREVVREVVAKRMLGEGGEVELELPPEPVNVESDPDHAGRMIESLLANAVSYTRDGQARWARVTVAAKGRRALVTVEDRGRGIAAEHRERIFERFYRVDDPVNTSRSGTGLGLYIARELARQYGGRVDLRRSRPGAGSRFLLTLPLKR
jgi:PAS domain S-box-containing protein